MELFPYWEDWKQVKSLGKMDQVPIYKKQALPRWGEFSLSPWL